MAGTTLYQFSLCPFCNKVRAALELKGIEFVAVEVSPRNKKELPELPQGTPRKVPVLQAGGQTIADSTAIMKYIEETMPGKMSFRPDRDDEQERAEEIEEWVDAEFIQSLPTVLYGTRQEARQAARIIARGSKLGAVQNFAMRVAGSLIMRQVAKRILKKSGKTDAHTWVNGNVQQFSSWLADKPYVTGEQLSIGDVAMHGALTCVKEFPIFAEAMSEGGIAQWYERVDETRRMNRAPA